MSQTVSTAYPAFFDDAEQKTASVVSQLYRRAYPAMQSSLSHLLGSPASGGHMRMMRQAASSIGNAGVGMVGGNMLDRMTGGDGTTGSFLGSLAGLSPYFGGARGRRFMSAMAPRVLAAKALDSVQRSRMGYSTLDPSSVKTHMQESMASELEPIIAPWRGMVPSGSQSAVSPQAQQFAPQTNAQLIQQMRGAINPTSKPRIPGFFG